MENGSFRKGLETVGRFFTGRLSQEQREKILEELSQKEKFARKGILYSAFLNPDRDKVPEGLTVNDLRVVRGELPLSSASDKTLRHIHILARAMEKAHQKRTL